MNDTPIPVTKTYLPALEDYSSLLEGIWDNHWVTNNGPLIGQLEANLSERIGTPVRIVSNGTIALQIAARALRLTGSVITTPYSYVATTNALLWEKLEPVFVDIEPTWYGLDPSLVEAAIRPDTTGILATHVYGYPCDHRRLSDIAERHGLKIIYDAAHAFDVKVEDQNILQWGDISTLSFHATKVFHMVEGGGVVARDRHLNQQFDLLRAFGHVHRDYLQLGTNAKNSEFHSAIGLLNLKQLPTNYEARKAISESYQAQLGGIASISTLNPKKYPGLSYNYAYYPIFCTDNGLREALVDGLNAEEIYPRRYFEPSLNTLPFLPDELRVSCPVSEHAARTVLCLPLYPSLSLRDVDRICDLITSIAASWK